MLEAGPAGIFSSAYTNVQRQLIRLSVFKSEIAKLLITFSAFLFFGLFRQAEIVKASLNGEWVNLNTSVEAFVSRWTQSKARLDAAHDVHYEEMADRCRTVFEAIASWKKFITDREELV